jgi:amidase
LYWLRFYNLFDIRYRNGGNMDLRQLEAGASILLPCLVDGGMLYIGDLHAAMGEGEPTWVGFESAGTAIVRVSVIHNKPVPYPRLLLGDRIGFTAVASGKVNKCN